MDTDNQPKNHAWVRRGGIGILTAITLHQTIYAAVSIVTRIGKRNHGNAVVSWESSFWLLLWLSILSAVICWGKPRLREWAMPFTWIVGFWFLGAALRGRIDTPQDAARAAFFDAMFSVCFCVWGLAVLLAVVRWILTALGIPKKLQ